MYRNKSTYEYKDQYHRRSQDFVWGAIFAKKVDDLFLVVALKIYLHI